MKLSHEHCNELFACFPIDLKRWIIATATEMDAAVQKHPEYPTDKVHAAAIVSEESGELVRACLQYTYEKGRYYDMHREAIQTAGACFRFLLNAPELPFNADQSCAE